VPHFFIGLKMTLKELKEKHKELNEEVDKLSEFNRLTPAEKANLKNLKKLKLKYKDTINKLTYDD
tara:strand:- start:1951 stop:2145 length:195 start_codon:yes stop_codon:yes gene_type:complete